MGRLRIAVVFAILAIAPFISNTAVTMAILWKALWAPFHHKLAQHNFLRVYI